MKLVQETKCPHCEKAFEIESDLDKLDIKPPPQTATASTTTDVLEQTATQGTAETPKVEIKHVIPSHIPGYSCKDASCKKAHKNKSYSRLPEAKCENCGQFTADKSKECPWCKNTEFEDLDQEELIELGLPMPEHDHGDQDAL